jgi:hypothetical protein
VPKIGCLAAFASAVLVASPGRAIAGPYTDDEETAEAKAGQEKAAAAERLEVGGRVFVRSSTSRTDLEASADDPWVHQLNVPSARIVADYRRKKRLKVMVEAEFGDDDMKLKDGYIRVRPVRELSIQAGRFKRPMSSISLESAWRLPVVERGILNELEPQSAAELPFGGRSEGVTVEYKMRDSAAKPAGRVGVFMPEVAENVIDVSEHFALDPYARVEAEPVEGVTAGASFALITHQRRRDDRESIAHAPFGSVDVVVRAGPLKAWLEGFFGRSTVYDAAGRTRGAMWAARTIFALRFKRVASWLRRAGPYFKASLFDPNDGATGDRASQVGGGINAQFSKFLRLQLEVEQTWVQDMDLLLLGDRLAVYLQLGAAF